LKYYKGGVPAYVKIPLGSTHSPILFILCSIIAHAMTSPDVYLIFPFWTFKMKKMARIYFYNT